MSGGGGIKEDMEKEENKQEQERRDRGSLHLQRTLQALQSCCHVNTRQIVLKHWGEVQRNPSLLSPPSFSQREQQAPSFSRTHKRAFGQLFLQENSTQNENSSQL